VDNLKDVGQLADLQYVCGKHNHTTNGLRKVEHKRANRPTPAAGT